MNLPTPLVDAISNRMKSPFVGVVALFTGGTVSVKEIITNGSLWLTFGGALLAFAGGIWTWKTARTRYQIEVVKLKQAELEFARAARHPFVGSRKAR